MRVHRQAIASLAGLALAVPGLALLTAPSASAAPSCTGSPTSGQVVCSPNGAGYVTYTVPAHVSSISIVADGGGGGKNASLGNGGSGARVSATVTVAAGNTVKIYVGSGGGAGLGGSGNTGGIGYGSGGNGGPYYGEGFGGGYGGGGGGSSAVLVNGVEKVVAGGGGGGGQLAGGSSTQNGADGGGDSSCPVGGGGGSAGNAGTRSGTGNTTAATGGYAGQGGNGTYGAGGASSGGGGGGGGYGGGGPGNWRGPYGCSNAGGGGGGGSFVVAGASAVTYGSAANAGGVATSGAGGSGQVTVTFTNSPTVPGAVTGLNLADITTTSMNAYWTPPADDGGSTLLGYDVTVGATTTRTTDPVFALTSLTPATSYTVNVKAVNAQGSSSNAAATATTTAPTATVPDPPRTLTFTSVTSIAITANWIAPASDGGSAILGYQVQVDGGSRTWTTDTTYTADLLTSNASHTFNIYAVNVKGASTALTGSQSTLATVPGTPTNLVFSNISDTSITASWTAPTDNGGAAIDQYFVAVDGGASVSVAASTTSYTKTGLTAETWHSFTVNAHNNQGNSGDLTGSQATTAAASAPSLTTSSATVGTSNAVTLTNYPNAEAETVYVTAPDGSSSTYTLTTSAGGAGSLSYTPTMAGTYTIMTAPTARSTTSVASNASSGGGQSGGGGSSASTTTTTASAACAGASCSTAPVITTSGSTPTTASVVKPTLRTTRVVYSYSTGKWKQTAGKPRIVPARARATVVTTTTSRWMSTRHLASALRFAHTLTSQVTRRKSDTWRGPAVVVVTWTTPIKP